MGTSSVASDEEMLLLSCRKNMAMTSNSTSVTDSQLKQPRKAYEKRGRARVRDILIIGKHDLMIRNTLY